MNLESIVTSYELAKQLYELGIVKDSVFWWASVNGGKAEVLIGKEIYQLEIDNISFKKLYPAPSDRDWETLSFTIPNS